jgi:ribokinase
VKKTGKIVVVGGSNTDMTIMNQRLPVAGGIVAGGQFTMRPGGKGANQAVAVARMGGDVSFITKTGNDLFGIQSKQLYKAEGIRTDYVFSDPDNPSGVAMIMMDNAGNKCISIAQGSIRTLSTADIDKAKAEIESAEILIMELEIPQPTAEYIAEIAFAAGVTMVINPSPIQCISQELLKRTGIIIPNRTEAEWMTGIHVCDWESARKAALRIQGQGVATVIVTLGALGVLICGKDGFYEIPAEKVDSIDNSAAGDTFCGTLCVGLTEGMSIVEAARMACKAAAIAVTRLGIQESIPYRKELD